jgi:signal transduction histidine kinase
VAGPFLKEVFENLLTNAVQHNNSENSWVKVKISEYNRENKDYLKLDFIDNGRGIPNNIKDKIFSQGFKGQQTTNGMGIGLSLVKTILEAYNGNIWVKNRVEGNYKEGSIFSIILPKA